MFTLSTGEPPTPPVASASPVAAGSSVRGLAESRLSAQEQDSGYEASPCSIADNTSEDLHFFGEEETTGAEGGPSLNSTSSSDDVFHDCVPSDCASSDCASSFVLLEPENSSEWCHDCCAVSPCCCTRAESSATICFTPEDDPSNCDSSNSSSSGQSSSVRPSSLPIRIPNIDPHLQTLPWTNFSSRPSNTTTQPIQVRASPMSISPNSLIPFPRSCPAIINWYIYNRHFARLRVEVERSDRRTSLQSERQRRRRIDSDVSSSEDSSDDNILLEGGLGESYPEVFPMTEEDASTSPRRSPIQPLPDIILHSSPSIARRNRSISINLPPEPEVLQDIGRSLRRLSDQFEVRRQANRIQRRQTIAFDRFYRPS